MLLIRKSNMDIIVALLIVLAAWLVFGSLKVVILVAIATAIVVYILRINKSKA